MGASDPSIPAGAGATQDATVRRGCFVGRERDLALLRAALEEVLDGSGRLLLLAGEPGIGKTRTAEELARHARERGAHVAWGRCWEEEGAPDLWPWLQVIRACLRTLDEATLRALVGPHATELTTLVAPPRVQHADAAPAPETPAARFGCSTPSPTSSTRTHNAHRWS